MSVLTLESVVTQSRLACFFCKIVRRSLFVVRPPCWYFGVVVGFDVIVEAVDVVGFGDV